MSGLVFISLVHVWQVNVGMCISWLSSQSVLSLHKEMTEMFAVPSSCGSKRAGAHEVPDEMSALAYEHVRGLQAEQIAPDWDWSTKTALEHLFRTCSGDFCFGVKGGHDCK